MVFDENFYTYRNQRMASDLLHSEYLDLQVRGDVATARTAEIEYHLARGHERYHRRHYLEALSEYQLALGLIYRLIEPRFDPRLALGLDVRLPVRHDLFVPIMETVLTVLDRTANTVPPVVVAPPIPIDPLIDRSLLSYRNLGIESVLASSGRPAVAEKQRLAEGYAKAGQHDRAVTFYREALSAMSNDDPPAMRAGLQHSLGIALGEVGDFQPAFRALDQASQHYAQVGDHVSEAVVHENVAALHTRTGHYEQARGALSRAESLYTQAAGANSRKSDTADEHTISPHDFTNATVRLTRQRNSLQALTQRSSFFGRLTSRIRRALEPETVATPTMRLHQLAESDVNQSAAASIATDRRVLRIATGIEAGEEFGRICLVEVALDDARRTTLIQDQVYQGRVGVKTLEGLGIRIGATFLPDHFRIHIPHTYFFTVQVCLGDVYLALGQFPKALEHYVQARDYRYLNLPLEAPSVWIRISRCLVTWGYALYRKNQILPALEKFQQVVTVSVGGARTVPAASPLYNRAPFADIQLSIAAFLPTMDVTVPAVLNPEMAILIRQARVYQEMIHAGLNALGLPLELIPIFRFRYLQAVARYFAEQAIKAERDYINFKATSEQETASLMQLQQAEALSVEAVKLEQRRVEEAAAERTFAEQSRQLAAERVANANERRDEYVTVSADKVALDTASAHASGGFTETEGGYQVNLTSTGQSVNLGDEDYEIMRNAAWHRGWIQRGFELNDMQRTIDEYTANLGVADSQVALAGKRQAVAAQNKVIADLRLTQASANREFAENKTFNAELWNNLADRMRELSQSYLDRAVEISLLMQAAYNFEADATLNKIGIDYTTGAESGGLLGGDALLADINYFTYHYITQTKSKEVPVKTIISLAERYPFVLFQFRRTGVAHFETTLADFDRLFPGSYMHKVRAIEVVVEGLIGADGLNGSLKNSGISTFRTRNNLVKVRLQPRETMLLSSYSLKGDAVVVRPSEETLDVFEGSGAATAWTLEIPPGSNDINYEAISDLKLVLYYDVYHDSLLENTVRAALPTTGQRSRSFSLRVNYPDAFFFLMERGETDFDIRLGDFPYNQVDILIQRLALYVIPERGASVAAVALQLTSQLAGHEANAITDANGVVTSDASNPSAVLNVFHNDSPIDHWRVALDPEANPALFPEAPEGDGNPRVQGIRDIVMAIDYQFSVRTAANL